MYQINFIETDHLSRRNVHWFEVSGLFNGVYGLVESIDYGSYVVDENLIIVNDADSLRDVMADEMNAIEGV